MPSMDDCINEIIAAGNGSLDREDAEALLRRFADRITAKGVDPISMARQIGDMATAAAIIEKRNRLMNLRIKIAGDAKVEGRIAEYRAAGRGDQSLAMAIQTDVRAYNTPATESRYSAEAAARQQSGLYTKQMNQALRDAGLAKPLRTSRAFQRDVGRELYEMSRAAAGGEHKMGFTGNKPAFQAAEIINKWQSLVKENLNRAGAWIGDYSGYITQTTHDPAKMAAEGFPAWRTYTLSKLDQERTFEGVVNIDEFMSHVYDNLKNGIHTGSAALKDLAFKGAASLAKRVSGSRILHFADADSWLDYQEKFGVGTLPTQIEAALSRGGKQQQLMERWGTNPRAAYEDRIDRFIKKYQHIDPDGTKYLNDHRPTMMNEFGFLDGQNNRAVSEYWANLSQGARNVGTMAHLGMVSFTHIDSLATKAAELRHQDIGFLERWGNILGSFVQGRTGIGDRKELYDLLLAGFDGQHGHYMSRFTLDDNLPGVMSNATAAFMKWTGLPWLLDAQKAGSRYVMARKLGLHMDQELRELPPGIQRGLLQYGISENDWNLLRSAPDHFAIDDRKFLTPQAAYRIAPQEASDGTDLMTQRMRDDLALKLHTYLSDVADRGIVTPGIPEQALFFQGTQKGTPLGEALRFMAQFKMWAAADVRQGIGREWYGNADFSSRAAGIISLVVSSTILGYLGNTLKDAMKGKTPRDPRSPATWAAAMLQGGGLGILGDFLFGNFSSHGQTLSDFVVGPTIGTLGQMKTIFDHMKEAALAGDSSTHRGHPAADIGPEMFRLALDNTPFINLFWARTILNYMFLWRLQEWMNPGFQRRSERRIQKETGQTFWLSPAQAVH